jgi:oligopeptide/dipeptide ABC transporter ATP-binding protein
MRSGPLEVHGLSVELAPAGGKVVFDASFTVAPGEVLGVVGESGAGKSIMLRAVLGLLPAGFTVTSGEVWVDGGEVLSLGARDRARLRGRKIAFVPQEPLTALNPLYTVGLQLRETLRAVAGLRGDAARRRALELLEQVGLAGADRVARQYPHELSGGMRQRVMIAIALAGAPAVILCDEPTTALDATVQARVLDLLSGLAADRRLAIVLVTHDIGVVARTCGRVAVMYAGRIVESGRTLDVLSDPRHPYTTALLQAVPVGTGVAELRAIPGSPPEPGSRPSGCAFHPRCAHAMSRCHVEIPATVPVGDAHAVECVLAPDTGITFRPDRAQTNA